MPASKLYAFLRIGLHAGIRTNLCSKDMLVGMGKSNRSLELDALGKSLIPVTVAHSRNKLVIPHPKAEKLFRGKDTSIPRLLQAMKKGVSRGR